jgi:cytochrome c oxidase subunit IV
MSDHGSNGPLGSHSGHVVPVTLYVGVFLALMVLTALTTGIAYIDLGAFNTVVALVIAVIKMLLVVLFFMHIKWAKGLTRIAVIAGFFWLGIMITFTLADELTRRWEINPVTWLGSFILPLAHRLF